MRWTRELGRLRGPAARAGLLLGVVLALLLAPSAQERRLAVYSASTRYEVRMAQREGKDYVAVVEVLQPLGQVSARVDGKKFKLRFKNTDAEFVDGKTQVQIGKYRVELSGASLVGSDGAWIPAAAVPALLAHLLGTHIDYHSASRRVIIGDADVKFTAEMRKGESPALVLNFSSPVNPSISTEAGQLRMVFTRDPVVSTAEKFSFEDRLIPVLEYGEFSGAAQLTVRGTAPLLATFSNGGRTITIGAAPAHTPPAVAAEPTSPPLPPLPGPEAAPPAAPVVGGVRPRFLVVLDPAHGGDDRGALLADQMPEKDVTLALARRLRAELQNRGINTLLLRDGDVTLSLQQRAEAANSSHAAVYISLHADVLGTGVRVYTSLLPPPQDHAGGFVPWETAQAEFLQPSRVLAGNILEELSQKQIGRAMLPAPVRPLNNVLAVAVAVEVAPLRPDIASLNQASYQQSVVTAIANAVAAARPQGEAPR